MCNEKLIIKCPILDFVYSGLELSLGLEAALTLASIILPNNNLFQKFIKTFIKRVQVLATLVAPAKTRDVY